MKQVTVFGGSGFLGRYIVKRLSSKGYKICIAARYPESVKDLQKYGEEGQIALVKASVDDLNQVENAIKGSDAVVNLVGILYETRKHCFTSIHSAGVAHIATAAHTSGIKNIVHISAIGASTTSESAYARSKAAGERVLQALVPEAVILRPSIVFGPEDSFFNRFAQMLTFSPFVPMIGGKGPLLQPVYVDDVANAVAITLGNAEHYGKVFELGGPERLYMADTMRYILQKINKRRMEIYIPFSIAKIIGWFSEFLPVPPLTTDQVKLLKYDNVVNENALKLQDLGIEAKSIDSVVPSYLQK